MNIFNEQEWSEFRNKHPELRFWQAMSKYLFVDKIYIQYADDGDITREDTFYWQDEQPKIKAKNRSSL